MVVDGLGDARIQGIRNHDIDYVEPDQLGPRTLRVLRSMTLCETLLKVDHLKYQFHDLTQYLY